MHRLEFQRLLDGDERSIVLAGKKQHIAELVPAFGELRRVHDKSLCCRTAPRHNRSAVAPCAILRAICRDSSSAKFQPEFPDLLLDLARVGFIRRGGELGEQRRTLLEGRLRSRPTIGGSGSAACRRRAGDQQQRKRQQANCPHAAMMPWRRARRNGPPWPSTARPISILLGRKRISGEEAKEPDAQARRRSDGRLVGRARGLLELGQGLRRCRREAPAIA